ncbi:MAG: hypothetical protein K9M97_11820 [Akkermansiaceae bacterium]|nr:hypothetical protein [Akkermansiaceae bacterium]
MNRYYSNIALVSAIILMPSIAFGEFPEFQKAKFVQIVATKSACFAQFDPPPGENVSGPIDCSFYIGMSPILPVDTHDLEKFKTPGFRNSVHVLSVFDDDRILLDPGQHVLVLDEQKKPLFLISSQGDTSYLSFVDDCGDGLYQNSRKTTQEFRIKTSLVFNRTSLPVMWVADDANTASKANSQQPNNGKGLPVPTGESGGNHLDKVSDK